MIKLQLPVFILLLTLMFLGGCNKSKSDATPPKPILTSTYAKGAERKWCQAPFSYFAGIHSGLSVRNGDAGNP
jgi:hypothetical protein